MPFALMIYSRRVFCAVAVSAICLIGCAAPTVRAAEKRYVIHLSVDGLRPDAVTALGKERAPNFYRLREEGAFTDNARTDFNFTITLPNHTCQVTGRPVRGPKGHHYEKNNDPRDGETLQDKGEYIAGVFDVVHDHGLRTGIFACKTKFSLYRDSWDDKHGAPDTTGDDNGRNKVDEFAADRAMEPVMGQFYVTMSKQPCDYSFLHWRLPDSVGHAETWDVKDKQSKYLAAVEEMDCALGSLLRFIDETKTLKGKTVLLITADHGGMQGIKNHGVATDSQDYTIPFYAWGAGVDKGTDLYELNADTRLNPSDLRPPYTDGMQPIRNGDIANLALTVLGLPAIPGSTINARQNLRLSKNGDSATAKADDKAKADEPAKADEKDKSDDKAKSDTK